MQTTVLALVMQHKPADEVRRLRMQHVDTLLYLLQCFQCLWICHKRLHRWISQLQKKHTYMLSKRERETQHIIQTPSHSTDKLTHVQHRDSLYVNKATNGDRHLVNVLWHHVLQLLLHGCVVRKHRMFCYQLTANTHAQVYMIILPAVISYRQCVVKYSTMGVTHQTTSFFTH